MNQCDEVSRRMNGGELQCFKFEKRCPTNEDGGSDHAFSWRDLQKSLKTTTRGPCSLSHRNGFTICYSTIFFFQEQRLQATVLHQ